ncbi:hypothetical protein KSD_11130 [Ktedonobacter sp. SOSP1-85]|uniref:hypothetical protein n=1 Tax=Ktedonobacter sp. SOSP1-85 TaxID=2778367 RepID=UPI001915EA97|nr:hypothetical protein [Ktedonobacter sp. SOSP1-85]GHO73342.1 hypothetical protein KSD_11130 [Ktedonobacter sp. SOSP1-85]
MRSVTPINIWSTDATRTPWLGFGIEWDAETNDIQPLQLSQTQWDMLYTRLDYMRPAWIRSMIDVQWFCPEGVVGRYSFNSSSMLAWYPILDYARAHNIPLTMGTWDLKPWDYHTNQYATALSDLLHYLIHERGYNNIRYTNGVNEPDTKLPSFQDWEAFNQQLYTALEHHQLTNEVEIIGPDTANTNGWITNSTLPSNKQTGAYEWHNYVRTCCDIQHGQVESIFRPIVERFKSADPAQQKLLLLGEMGWGYQSGPGDNQHQVKTYQYGLEMADYAIQLARAGMSGGAAWNLDDAMHNKVWGMWNISTEPLPRPWFYSWSLLSRYLRPGATIYHPEQPMAVRLLAAEMSSAANPARHYWTLMLLNRQATTQAFALKLPENTQQDIFHQYVYSDKTRLSDASQLPLPVAASRQQKNGELITQVPANSLVMLTSLDTGPDYNDPTNPSI